MTGKLTHIITATDPQIRNQSLEAVCQHMELPKLLEECRQLENLRQQSHNLYERVRALFLISAVQRYYVPQVLPRGDRGLIPYEGYLHLLDRRFGEAIESFLDAQKAQGPSDAISSALAAAYYALGFQTLAEQVRRSVKSARGNQWMFRMGNPSDHPLRVRQELLQKTANGVFPILRECTPVRMDLSHSGWSDIFFLAMDYPEGARVLNVSIDLGVRGRDRTPKPPVEAYFRVIDEPVLKLVSVDLGASVVISRLDELFDFAKDYLGLLKAAVIASGIVPPGIEGSEESLVELLSRLVEPGYGIEIVSSVNNIPKGSRLAVSTSLLASLISVCMRATNQARHLTGLLSEQERRVVAARAILGEWLAGSGGGWQDSGGVWPGIKLIRGVLAEEDDPEYGISRGRLLPRHDILESVEAPPEVRAKLQDSLVLVHGGMAQNVGPILEMVTERYLLRLESEWKARQEAATILDRILAMLREGDIQGIAAATTQNFFGPLQKIIPWASNFYSEALIRQARFEFGEKFWGFWMLGGMSGGGMGFIFDPGSKEAAQARLQEMMRALKSELSGALPFAMEPVVYDFSINEHGTLAKLLEDEAALLPQGYYSLMMPQLLRVEPQRLSQVQRAEMVAFGSVCRGHPEYGGMVETLFDRLVPHSGGRSYSANDLFLLLDELGFDRAQHEQIRADMKTGRIGLAQNLLPSNVEIKDVEESDVFDATEWFHLPEQAGTTSLRERAAEAGQHFRECRECGEDALASGQAAVLTLAAGIGSRWTQGAGVVKALHPFCKWQGRHRTFIEVHLAKSRSIGHRWGTSIPHLISTSYLTHQQIEEYLSREKNYGYPGPLLLSSGRSVGLRLVPMVRDLRFLWEETSQQQLDEQAQKVRDSLRSALVQWALQIGEGSDYTDNVPLQCLHPVGHWYEVPNLFKNGILGHLLENRPQLKYLMVHNIDTLGANLDPAVLGLHILGGVALSFEVITRRIEDRGGGLARVDGRVRLVEGLAMPHEEDEFRLSYYNSNTAWVDIDRLLQVFGLTRNDLASRVRVDEAVRNLAARMPSYVTLKEVKKRWGYGQEDIYPVAQFEKLWGDMTGLPELKSMFLLVPRLRGQQLKDPAQLDGWLRDGSAAYVESLVESWNG